MSPQEGLSTDNYLQTGRDFEEAAERAHQAEGRNPIIRYFAARALEKATSDYYNAEPPAAPEPIRPDRLPPTPPPDMP